MKKIQVWIKEPHKSPRHVWISNSLKNLQNTVGGYIEHVSLSKDVGIIVNEEGVVKDLPFNCSFDGMQLFGTVIWIGYDGEDFGSCPLTNEDMHKYYEFLYEKEKKS